MEQVPLTAEKRTVTGRKVKKLRKDGLIPAHVFGHGLKTEHIQLKAGDFAKVFEKVGQTGIIDLTVGSAKKPVMVKGIQIHPVTDLILHIDFYQVNLSEKVKVNVPLAISGEAPALEKKLGLLLTPVTEVEVEALPTDIPESIQVDVTSLVAVGDELKVKDLKFDRAKVEILADDQLVVVQIGELITKEMEAVEAEMEAEAAATVEAAEGEAAPAVGAEAPESEAAEGESNRPAHSGSEPSGSKTDGEKPQETKEEEKK